jgi:hypothetical protein
VRVPEFLRILLHSGVAKWVLALRGLWVGMQKLAGRGQGAGGKDGAGGSSAGLGMLWRGRRLRLFAGVEGEVESSGKFDSSTGHVLGEFGAIESTDFRQLMPGRAFMAYLKFLFESELVGHGG